MKWRYCNSGYLLSSAALRKDAGWYSAAVRMPIFICEKTGLHSCVFESEGYSAQIKKGET